VKYYVYIIFSQSVDRFYTGYTVDPTARLVEHNLGATPSTRPGRPWTLVYAEECENKTAAIIREKEIKRKKSRKYIERLVQSKRES
jgi:putative endonuclease